MQLSLVISFVLCFAVTHVHGISFDTDGPKYPGAEGEYQETVVECRKVIVLSSPVLPLGRDGLDQAFESWFRLELNSTYGPYLWTDVKQLTASKVVKNLDKLIKGVVRFENITFFNMGEVKWNREPASYSYQMYGDYNDEVIAERHWGQFEVKHQSFLANVTFTRVKDDESVTCPAVGFIDIKSDTADYTQKVNYNVVIIREPFKFIGNRWNAEVDRKMFGYIIYVDPACTGFDDPERDTTKFTTALDKSPGLALPVVAAEMMKEHYEKWVIEPHRAQMIGSPRMNNSLWEPPAGVGIVSQNLWDEIKHEATSIANGIAYEASRIGNGIANAAHAVYDTVKGAVNAANDYYDCNLSLTKPRPDHCYTPFVWPEQMD